MRERRSRQIGLAADIYPHRRALVAIGLAATFFIAPWPAPAQEFALDGKLETSSESEPKNYVNFRAGFGSDSPVNRPAMCLELAPVAVFSLEACGSGRGFLYNEPGREISHFRGKWKIKYFRFNEQWLVPELALGFAELEVGEDRPGFKFSADNIDAEKTSAVGPELATSLQWLHVLPKGFEILGNVGGGLAWIPAASSLVERPSVWQPFIGLSLGVGW